MNTTELLAAFRTEVADTAAPYLWTDNEVIGYIDDAQRTFCRLTDGIADAKTASVCTLTIDAGDVWAPLSPVIRKIRAAYRVDDGRELALTNYEDLFARGVRLDGASGRLEALVLGMTASAARLYPIPDEALTVQLIVHRMPLTTLLIGSSLEIDEQHHRHLLHWVKHLAHLKQDAETFDKGRAAEYEALFRRYCEQAQRELDRLKHKPRLMAYGGY